MSMSMSTLSKSGLNGISADGPSATLCLRGDLARPVTAHNERTGACPIDSLHTLLGPSILAKLNTQRDLKSHATSDETSGDLILGVHCPRALRRGSVLLAACGSCLAEKENRKRRTPRTRPPRPETRERETCSARPSASPRARPARQSAAPAQRKKKRSRHPQTTY